jgi:lysophospholipase L1-like esterase
MGSSRGATTTWRARPRLLGFCAAMVLSATCMAVSVSSASALITQTQLSLGDSQAFGYSEQLFNEFAPAESPSAFEHGYANYFFKGHGPGIHHIQLIDDACPGETTESFIGNGALAVALGVSGEAPCAYQNTVGLPLHHSYGLGQSQLENALELITTESAAGHPVTTITLNVGFNDVLRAIEKCEAEVASEFVQTGSSIYGSSPALAVQKCIVTQLPATYTQLLTNVALILNTLRNGSSYGSINYTGEIVVLGTYDPYGKLFANIGQANAFVNAQSPNQAHYTSIDTAGEVFPGFKALITVLNTQEGAAIGANACFADPESYFNPGPAPGEPNRLKHLTNMANANPLVRPPFDGPDIHPTPAGYHRLSIIMKASCPLAPS